MNKKTVEIINQWNPIKTFPLLEDEYYPEIKRIEKYICDNKETTSDKLAKDLTTFLFTTLERSPIFPNRIKHW